VEEELDDKATAGSGRGAAASTEHGETVQQGDTPAAPLNMDG
jgi:hypothetical protein